MSTVGEWRCDALSSGAKRSRKWCKEVISPCHINRNRRRIKANEQEQFFLGFLLYQALEVNPS